LDLQGLLLSGNFTALVSKWMGRQQEEFQIEKKISLPLKTVSNFDLIPLKINRQFLWISYLTQDLSPFCSLNNNLLTQSN
jgi:hypothetical protein